MSKIIDSVKPTLPKVAKITTGGKKADNMDASETITPSALKNHYVYDYEYYDYNPSKNYKLQQQQAALLYNKAFAKRQSLAAAGYAAAGSDPYGSYSSSKYDECDNGISLGLLTTALLGIGVMFFTLFTKITMGRKKRSLSEDGLGGVPDSVGMLLEQFQEFALGGKI